MWPKSCDWGRLQKLSQLLPVRPLDSPLHTCWWRAAPRLFHFLPVTNRHRRTDTQRGLEYQSKHLSHAYNGEVQGYWFLSPKGRHCAVLFCAWSLSHWEKTFSVWVTSATSSHIQASLGGLMSNRLLDLSWLMSKTSQQLPVRSGMSEGLTHWNVE